METIRKQLKLHTTYPYDSSYFYHFILRELQNSLFYIFLAIDMNVNQKEE